MSARRPRPSFDWVTLLVWSACVLASLLMAWVAIRPIWDIDAWL